MSPARRLLFLFLEGTKARRAVAKPAAETAAVNGLAVEFTCKKTAPGYRNL